MLCVEFYPWLMARLLRVSCGSTYAADDSRASQVFCRLSGDYGLLAQQFAGCLLSLYDVHVTYVVQ